MQTTQREHRVNCSSPLWRISELVPHVRCLSVARSILSFSDKRKNSINFLFWTAPAYLQLACMFQVTLLIQQSYHFLKHKLVVPKKIKIVHAVTVSHVSLNSNFKSKQVLWISIWALYVRQNARFDQYLLSPASLTIFMVYWTCVM